MILLDLELILIHYHNQIKQYEIFLPGQLITTSLEIVQDNFDTSSSLFNILILGQRNIQFIHTYEELTVKQALKYPLYNTTKFYFPDSNGSNILQLTQNDLQFLTDINQDITPTTAPDADFLKAYEDLNYQPSTLLGKIIKLVVSIESYISKVPNYVNSL